MGSWEGYLDDLARVPAARQPATLGEIWNSEWQRGGLDTITGIGKPLADARNDLATGIENAAGKPLAEFAADHRILLGAGVTTDQHIAALNALADRLPAEQQEKLKELRDVRRRAAANAQKIEKDAADVSSATYGASGTATAWAASIARQTADPVNLGVMAATAPIGGPVTGRALQVVGRQALAGALGQAAVEPYIEPARAELGLEAGVGRAATNIFEAGVGGAAIAGAGLGIAKLFRVAADSFRGARPEAPPAQPQPVAAILYKGELYRGRPGEAHLDVAERNNIDFMNAKPQEIDVDLFVLPDGEVVNRNEMANRGLPESMEDIYPQSKRSDQQIIEGLGRDTFGEPQSVAPTRPNIAAEDFDAMHLHAERDAVIHDQAQGDPVAHAQSVRDAGLALEEGRPLPDSRLRLLPTEEHIEGKSQVYEIKDADGNLIAEAEIVVRDRRAFIQNIQATDATGTFLPKEAAANVIGPAEMRSLLRQFQELRPDVEVVAGQRVTGSRQGLSDATQRVEIPLSRPPEQPELPLRQPIEPGPPVKEPAEVIGDPALARDLDTRLAALPDGEGTTFHVEQADKTLKSGTAKSFLKEIADDAKAVSELIDCIGKEPT